MRLAALGALGVVYGDIGTSPLYAIRESFEGSGHELAVTDANVLGVLSTTFWALVIVISIKYLVVVMRADNHGEGGILALTALVTPAAPTGRRSAVAVLVLIGLFGTALLYGDGMITPAISVLSAVEGTSLAAPGLEAWVVPLAVVILVGLFAIQRRGTAAIGRLFGPVMLVWFSVLAVLGAVQVLRRPEVLQALDPSHAVRFFGEGGWRAFLALGSIFLVVTGGEALYADMGHFGSGRSGSAGSRWSSPPWCSTTSARARCSWATQLRWRTPSTGWSPTRASSRWSCSPRSRRSSPRRR